MPIAYEGSKPYIFVSYSHRDTKFVHHVIDRLQSAGYRVWFDGGIEAGSEWPEYIASHLEGCDCVLTFISESFVASQNCRRELNFAQDLKKPLLNVHIEEVALSAGMRMQLGLSQAMYRNNFRSDDEFMDSLCRAKILEACREKTVEKVVMQPAVEKAPEPDTEGVFNWPANADAGTETDAEEEEDTLAEYEEDLEKFEDEIDDLMDEEDDAEYGPTPRGVKIAGWIAVILELSYFLLWPKILGLLTASECSVWMLILISVVPHVAIAIIGKLLIETVGARYPQKFLSDFSGGLFILSPVVAVIAAFTGISGVNYDLNGFLKFLISLGLNVIPAAIVIFIYALIDENKGAK